MARNDFHVIAYRILAYLYECLKNGVTPQNDIVSADTMGIPDRYFMDVLQILSDEGFITGAFVKDPYAQHTLFRGWMTMRITRAGIEFMQENAWMTRALKFLRDLKEVIPGI